jgi:hypothetical protein
MRSDLLNAEAIILQEREDQQYQNPEAKIAAIMRELTREEIYSSCC